MLVAELDGGLRAAELLALGSERPVRAFQTAQVEPAPLSRPCIRRHEPRFLFILFFLVLKHLFKNVINVIRIAGNKINSNNTDISLKQPLAPQIPGTDSPSYGMGVEGFACISESHRREKMSRGKKRRKNNRRNPIR